MKSFVLSLVVLATAYSSSAQIYTGPVSITAHEVGTMANQYDKWHTSWGSYDRTVVATKTIEMSIRNFKNTAIKTTVTVYFVSHGAEAGQAIQDFEFDRSGEITSRVTSPQSISNWPKDAP